MDKNSPCYSPDDDDIMHLNIKDTGRRKRNPISGKEYQIWRCPCGKKEIEIYPK